MKSTCAIAAALAAAVNMNASHAWMASPQVGLPTSSLQKSINPRYLPVVGGPNPKKSTGVQMPRARSGASSLQMSTSALVNSLVPKLGVITSTFLLFSPMAAVRKASKEEEIGDLNPTPLAIMASGTLWWVAYGLSLRNPYIAMSNLPGCIASVYYVTALLPLLKGDQLKNTRNIVVGLAAVALSAWTWLALTNQPAAQISSTLGWMALSLGIVTFGAPLSTIKTILQEKNAASILAPLTITQLINSGLWVAYGLFIKDALVYGPNLAGVGFGAIQLLLKIVYPS